MTQIGVFYRNMKILNIQGHKSQRSRSRSQNFNIPTLREIAKSWQMTTQNKLYILKEQHFNSYFGTVQF